jgi:hypothetical protein
MNGWKDMKLIGAVATKQTHLKMKNKLAESIAEITAIALNSCSVGYNMKKTREIQLNIISFT